MKTTQNNWSNNVPKVNIDPSLNKYEDVVLFPKKLAKAKEELKMAQLPPRNQAVENKG